MTLLSKIENIKANKLISKNGIQNNKASLDKVTLPKNTEIQDTKSMLNIFDQKIFHITIPCFHFKTAWIDTTSPVN